MTNDEKFSGKERAEAKVKKIKLTVRTNFITTCRKAPIQRSRHCHPPNNYQHYCDDSPATCIVTNHQELFGGGAEAKLAMVSAAAAAVDSSVIFLFQFEALSSQLGKLQFRALVRQLLSRWRVALALFKHARHTGDNLAKLTIELFLFARFFAPSSLTQQ